MADLRVVSALTCRVAAGGQRADLPLQPLGHAREQGRAARQDDVPEQLCADIGVARHDAVVHKPGVSSCRPHSPATGPGASAGEFGCYDGTKG